MTPAPYRTATSPEAPRVRRRWVVRRVPEGVAATLRFLAFTGGAYVGGGHTPASASLRVVIAVAVYAFAWCAAFVRREVVS